MKIKIILGKRHLLAHQISTILNAFTRRCGETTSLQTTAKRIFCQDTVFVNRNGREGAHPSFLLAVNTRCGSTISVCIRFSSKRTHVSASHRPIASRIIDCSDVPANTFIQYILINFELTHVKVQIRPVVTTI